MVPCNNRAEAHIGPAAKPADSRDIFPLRLSEDVGESVGRSTWTNSTGVGTRSVLASNIFPEPKYERGADKRLHEREGPGLDGAKPVNDETKFLQPKAGASVRGLDMHASSVSVKRQKHRRPINAIEDLFKGLD